MAFLTETGHGATMLDTLRGIPGRMRRANERRRRIAEVHRELTALSDRDLNDIGLSRSDIDRVARQSVDHG